MRTRSWPSSTPMLNDSKEDRKSTRLNSSHGYISYAVFCLKKKNIIHKNLSIAAQAAEVDKVKRSESGMIVDPITMAPHQLVAEAIEMMTRYRISGIPITEGPKLVGILTNRDLRFVTNTQQPIAALMTKDHLVTVAQGTSLDEAQKLLHQHRIEKLLVVDEAFHLKGLITIKDIEKRKKYPQACKDALGRLRVGAAV